MILILLKKFLKAYINRKIYTVMEKCTQYHKNVSFHKFSTISNKIPIGSLLLFIVIQLDELILKCI